jgi:hypothetical protein
LEQKPWMRRSPGGDLPEALERAIGDTEWKSRDGENVASEKDSRGVSVLQYVDEADKVGDSFPVAEVLVVTFVELPPSATHRVPNDGCCDPKAGEL